MASVLVSDLAGDSTRFVHPPDPGSEAGGQHGIGTLKRTLKRHGLMGLLATSIIVSGAVLGGATFISNLPGAWFFGTPGGPFGSLAATGKVPPTVAVLAVYGGLILLARVWLGLLRTLKEHPGVPVRRVVGVLAAWAAPLAVAPPLFSRDLYSYAGLGEMVSHHISPYVYGTGVLGSTPFSILPGPLWANTPSPYGPTFLWLDGLATRLSAHQVLADLVLLRVLALAGLALVVLGLPTLARAAGRDPARVVVLGAGSPLALMTLVGGAHNDALMVGLLVAGLAVARRFAMVPGIVLCALAAGVKAPALLGVVFLGWTWAGPRAPVRRRVARLVEAGAIGVATLALVSWGSGLGWGWLRTVSAADRVFTGVTPVDALSRLLTDAGHVVDLPLSLGTVREVAGALALLIAGAICLRLLLRSSEVDPIRGLGISLLALALLSPILWAWYLTWGAIVLAAVATRRLERVVVVVAIAGSLIGAAPLKTIAVTALNADLSSQVVLVVGLVVAALVLSWQPSGSRFAPRGA